MMSTVMREGKWQGEIRFRHFKTGEIIPMMQHFFVVRDEVGGQAVALGTIARDMRQQKKAVEALQEAQAELAHIGRVNTVGQLACSHRARDQSTALRSRQRRTGRTELASPLPAESGGSPGRVRGDSAPGAPRRRSS